MVGSASGRHIQLCDFTIKFPLPIPKLIRHSSRLALKFSINSVDGNRVGEQVLSARGDTKKGIWEMDGDVKIYGDQLLTASILAYIKDSTKELKPVTVSYTQLLAYAEARSEACYELIVDGYNSSFPINFTCSIKILSPPRKQQASTKPASSPGKSKSDKGRIGSNRALTPGALSTPSVADLERDYDQAAVLPARRKSQALNDIGRAYRNMYTTTHEMKHLERAISILGEALLPANSHPKLPKYLIDLIKSLLLWFEPNGSHDYIEDAISKSQDVVHIAETSDLDKYRYIFHYATARLVRLKDLEELGSLQNSIPFLNKAVGLIPDGHRDKPEYLHNLGDAFETRFERSSRVEDLEIAIVHLQKAVDLTPDGHEDKPDRLNSLGVAFSTRFDQFDRVEDLETAIVHTQKAVDLTPDGDREKPLYLEHLGNAFEARFDRLGHAEDLELAILHAQKAVDLTPDGHRDKPEYLHNLGDVLETRFDRLGRVEDLEMAITHMQRAVDLTPNGHRDKPDRLDSLGVALSTRFDRFDRVEDLESAIIHMQKAVDLTPDGHGDKPSYLEHLGDTFEERFDRLGRIEDLEMAIMHLQKAVDLTPDGHEDKPDRLNSLGVAFSTRFDRLDRVEDLEFAIIYLQKAIDLTPDGHRDKPLYLEHLGDAFEERFDRLGRIEDLEMAITHMQKAVDLTPDSHPDKPNRTKNLGTAFQTRFDRLGRVEDLELSIVSKQKCVDLTPDDHPDKPSYFNNLGSAFQKQFSRLNRVEDLEMAIANKQKAVDLVSDSHSEKPRYLNSLVTALETRFDQLGRVEDLEMAITHMQKAVDLTPDGDPTYLGNLGYALQTRFERLDRAEDLELAIAYRQKAVDLMPDGHENKPTHINNIGVDLQTRFRRLGRMEDLELAIAHVQRAVDLTPDGHPDKPSRINNLGTVFNTRFDRLGRIDDLEMAVAYMRKAVDLIPDGHPGKPRALSNLGTALHIRFNQLDRVVDLEMATALKWKVVDLTPDGHPNKPGYFDALGSILQARFQQLDRVEDLEMVIANKQKAVDLTPDGHPDKPLYLNNLGSAFEKQFGQFGRLKDLDLAIAHKQKAVGSAPDGHPSKSMYLKALGSAFRTRFGQLGLVEDLETALTQFSMAASLSTGSPRVRLNAARDWARASELLEGSGVFISSPLQPYHVAIDLLPRVAWLGIPISAQHALLEEIGGTVREAVSAAIKVKEYETAIEWAEAGRSIAWQNLLQLRTPVSELRSAHYDLADKLETISRQLDMSVRGGDSQMNGASDATNSRSHVQLALDWDNIVAEIRSKPGFELFLKPKSFNQLKRIGRDGPVVILNITENLCDALVLIPENNGDIAISNISLGGFSYAKGEALLKELKGLLSSKHLRARDSRKPRRMPIDNGNGPPLQHILRCLWLDVVKPIIDALAYQPQSTDLPHIWWCATGPLAFLPIHAAGLYDTDELGSKLSDYAVSSYTPTLSTLLDDSTRSQEDFRLLAIAQANALGASSIPMTEVEVKRIQTLSTNINVTVMMKEDATIQNVWHGMEVSNWVHLACHGQQNIKEPMKSGLLLYDGTLELQRLIEKPLPLADFAFLSACQTATGDESVAEESLHLAAGMLFAGYKGVIATMWSIMDDVGPRVAEDVYRVMLKDGRPNRKAGAHALHEAVRRLREDPKVDMLHWVPFIHIGR